MPRMLTAALTKLDVWGMGVNMRLAPNRDRVEGVVAGESENCPIQPRRDGDEIGVVGALDIVHQPAA